MKPTDAPALPFPQAVMIQTTSRCNSACIMCPQPQIRHTMPQGEMDQAVFEALLAELAGFPKLKRVMLYLMNEPLMDPLIVPRIRQARRALPETEIYLLTNGALLDERRGEELLDAGLTWIGFSVHAIRADTYQAITGRGDFERIRENITRHIRRRLERFGPDSTMVNLTRMRPYVSDEEWSEAQAYWRDLGVTRLDVVQGYISRAGNVEVFGHEPVSLPGVLGCRTVWAYEMAHVLFDGAVVPCCMDYRRQGVWGNVRDGGLLAVWRGPKRREFLLSMDGRDLAEDYLCLHCEDAIPADATIGRGAPLCAPGAGVQQYAPTPEESQSAKPADVLLVHPPPWLTTGPPLGLAALAAWVEREGFTAEVLDLNIALYQAQPAAQRRLWDWEEGHVWERERDVERLFGAALRDMARAIAEHPAPVIGFNLVTRKEIPTALVAREVMRLAPQKLLIAGGPGVATREERDRFFQLCGGAVRVFVVGEGELTLTAILQAARDGKSPEHLPGVAFYREGQATFVEQTQLVDLARLPVPDYRHFDLAQYGHPALNVEWSRGCTGGCAFCNVRRYWRRHRSKPAATALAELDELIRRHGIEWLSLVDPVVNGNPRNLESICDGLIERGLKLKWSAGLSPNHDLTAAQFAKMARAGCYRLEFGLESGSDRVLAAMNKRYTAERALRMIRDAAAAGIDVVLYLIVGFPGETEDDFAATMRAVEQAAPHVKLVRSVNSLLLIPGSELCDQPEKWGLEIPNRTQRGWERRWRAGESTAEVRADRLDRLLARLRELGAPVEFTNRDDVVSDRRRHREHIDELMARAAEMERRMQAMGARAESLLRPTASAPQATLAICPVWGVDTPPYGLASIAASAAAAGHRVQVRDFNIESYHEAAPELQRFWEEDSFRHWTDLADWSHLRPHLDGAIEKIVRELLATPAGVIGFSVYSPNRRFTIEVCRRIKQADPRRVIVVGGRGVHTAEERLLFPPDSVNYFVVGEGEQTFLEALAAIFAGRDAAALPGIVRFEGHHLTELAPRPLIQDLAALPPPNFAGFDLARYRTRELPLLATRGCINRCTFCNDHPAMGPFRARPGRLVAEEILGHVQRLGVRGFRFNDQLINGDLAALEEMCDALIAARADVQWIALASPRGDMRDELLHKMRRAGCYTLNLGIESGSDDVLRKMAKGYRVADIEKALGQIRAADINTMVNFIVGFPGETDDDFAQTLAFVRRNHANICGVTSINTCIMLLGSPLERNKDKFGIVVPTGAEPDTGWVQGENTPGLRQRRAKALLAVLEELGLMVRVSNLHEKAADLRALAAPPEPCACEAPPDAADQRKGVPRYEPIDAREVDLLLIMAPVWGADVPPLGIAYVQHFLQANGVSAQCLDLNIKLYNRAPDPNLWRMEAYKHWTDPALFPQTMQALADLTDHYATQLAQHPAKVLGFSVNTGNFAFTRAFARRLKAARPERPIVFGGPGVTNSFDIATLGADEADWLVLGEGEHTALLLMRDLLAGHTPNVEGVLRVGEPVDFAHLVRPIEEDLGVLGWPTLDDFNLAEYATDSAPILGSRGCIRRCTFCNDHHIYRKYRRRPPESVVEEMLWHADRGRTRFTFHDVLINGDMKTLRGFCELLIASGRELRWGGQGVIRKEMDEAIFRRMQQAGCQSFVFGVESFSNSVLQAMNKPYAQDETRAVLAACHAAGIQAIINLIVGFPGEGEKEFRETYDFVRDHADIIDQVASISPCLINLGSRLFERWPDYGIHFPQTEGSIKWWIDDGNTFEERRRRVLALTTLLSRRDQNVHTVNLYDEQRGALPQVSVDDTPREPDVEACDERAAPARRPDLLLALPPPWGVDFPPLGLAALTASLRADGFAVVARDLNIEWYEACGDALRDYWRLEHLKFWAADGRLAEIAAFFAPLIDEFVDTVARLQPLALGLSTNESNLPLAVLLGRRVKTRLPGVTLILGGPGVHWPADRERIGPSAADLFIVGEGEVTLAETLRAIKEGRDPAGLPGTAAWRDGAWVGGAEREPLKDLDALPPPEFDGLPLYLYRTNQLPLMMGRGCVNRCAFCNDHRMVPGYRAFSPERVFANVQRLKARFGAFAFAFNDLLVNADLRRLRRFCELVVASGERMAWTGQAVVRKDMTAKDFALLKQAGCVSLVFGVESFSDDVLKLMNKRFDAKTAARVLRQAREAGIETIINLIVGFPGETEEAFAATCDFVREHAKLISRVSALSTCIVVAQCALEKEPERFGIVLPQPEHWRQWCSSDGANTYEVRVQRLLRLEEILKREGIAYGMTNLYREALNETA